MVTIGEFARLGEVTPRMLRHYDELGLLVPQRVDVSTGYRHYDLAQLARLHRLVALRDLGFSLDQISALFTDEPSIEQLRGMLRLRQSQIEATLTAEQARLGRIEAHLRALERTPAVITQDVVIKTTQPLRIAELVDTADAPGPDTVGPIFQRLIPQVLAALARDGITPGINVGHYDEMTDEGLTVHVGFEIGAARVSDVQVRVVDLPVVRVTSLMHHGPLDRLGDSYRQLFQWTQDSGQDTTGRCRELYHQFDEENFTDHVIELQLVLTE